MDTQIKMPLEFRDHIIPEHQRKAMQELSRYQHTLHLRQALALGKYSPNMCEEIIRIAKKYCILKKSEQEAGL